MVTKKKEIETMGRTIFFRPLNLTLQKDFMKMLHVRVAVNCLAEPGGSLCIPYREMLGSVRIHERRRLQTQ